MNNNQMVDEFHRKFLLPRPVSPGSPPKDRRDLRIELIREELAELQQGIAEGNLVLIADGCADLLYVIYGTALEYGIDIDPIFAEVHRSNMSKLQKDGTPIIRSDGKVLKSDEFELPNIQAILLKQGMKS